MRVAVSSDLGAPLVEVVRAFLSARGYEVVYFGPEAPGAEVDWPLVTGEAADQVASGAVELAVVMCWTGTGASMAANKVSGVRAALCGDAETARGARRWNHANTLALSIRATSEPLAREILTAFLDEPWTTDEWNRTQMERIDALDRRRSAPDTPA